MDKRIANILSEMGADDARLLRTFLEEIFELRDSGDNTDQLRKKLEDTASKIRKIEAKALARIEERKANPICSFCGKKAHEIEKMFKKTHFLNICSDCIKAFHAELGNK